MRRPLCSMCLAFAFAVVSPRASGQTQAAAPTTSERPLDHTLQGAAKDAYGAAKVLFNNSDFAGAATKYSQAYDLSRDPRLLFNLAICEKNLRHYARTQSLLQQYEHDLGARIAPDDKAAVDAALIAIRNLVGSVRLTVTPAGASVSVDGQPAGTTPLAEPLRLDLGQHTLSVTKGGFATSEQTVDVAGGSETAVAVTLAAVVHTAHLVVLAEEDATVLVDQGTASKGGYDGRVASGVHTVQVTAAGKLAYKAEIDLKDDETRSVNVTLENEKHGTLWPWIVGGAVVVAGAAVGGYFLFRPQPAAAPMPPDQLGSLQLARWTR
jgi:hypothetical protein